MTAIPRSVQSPALGCGENVLRAGREVSPSTRSDVVEAGATGQGISLDRLFVCRMIRSRASDETIFSDRPPAGDRPLGSIDTFVGRRTDGTREWST
jgi:hypothetical protein